MSSTYKTQRRRDVTSGATSQPTEDIEDPSSELVWFYVQLVAGGLLDLTCLPKDQPLYPI